MLRRNLFAIALIVISALSGSDRPSAQDQLLPISPAIYLLPAEGSVGIGRELQMVIMQLRSPDALPTPIGADYTVHWTSSNSDTASIVGSRVKGISAGTVTINAVVAHNLDGVRRTLHSRITVAEPVAVASGPTTISIFQYCSTSIRILPREAAGRPLDNRPVTWQAENPDVGTSARSAAGESAARRVVSRSRF